MPTRAMVLAAGLGSRLRPLTETTPKPLIRVGGRALIDRVLDSLAAGGVGTAVVNLHYRGDQIEAHLVGRRTPRIVLSKEDRLLGTGGGIRRALPDLGDAPFFVMDCDTLRLDGPKPALRRLADAWDPARMDVMVLVMPTAKGIGMDDQGHFFVDPLGRARLPTEREVAPFGFASVQIMAPSIFADTPEEPFSHLALWRRAAEAERLWAVIHDGACLQVLTPDAVDLADGLLDERNARWVEP